MKFALSGYIASNDDKPVFDFFGLEAVCPRDVRKAVETCPAGETLTVEVNSGGGSVFAGYEMYSIFKAAACPTEGEIQSISGSAASVAMLGLDKVRGTPVAQVMVHLPGTTTEGDRNAHRQSIKVLDSIMESILNAYELKCKGRRTRDELRRMLEAESWMPVQAGVDAGFLDGVLYDEEGTLLPADIINSVGGGCRALSLAGGVPDLDKLRDAYFKARGVPRADGVTPPEDTDSESQWAQAALELEKIRYGG